MLLAIAVTSWHSQSYQLIIHDCRIRWQHDLTLLLQLLQVCTYLRHPLVSHKPFHDIVNTPRLIIVNLWVNETEPLHVPLLTFESWHFFFVNDLSHNILMFVVNKMIEIPIKREEQRYAFSFQSTKQNPNFFSRFFAPKN